MRFTVGQLRALLSEAFTRAYSILGVSPNASQDELKRAYRNKALSLHPDKNPGVDTTAQMAQANVAYGILSDPKKRAEYDRYGDRTLQEPQQQSASTKQSSSQSSGAPNDDWFWRQQRDREKYRTRHQTSQQKKQARATADDHDWKGSRKTREKQKENSYTNKQWFTYEQGTSSKFWCIWLDDPSLARGSYTVNVWWGRIGSVGSQKKHKISSLVKATTFIDDMIQSKLKKGYVRSTQAHATGMHSKKAPADEPKEQPKQQASAAQAGAEAGKARVIYGPHHGKPASAHFKGKIYTPQGKTAFSRGMRAQMALGSDGRLSVHDPESGATQAWDLDEQRELFLEYALHVMNQTF